jgi:hypothetical protein
VARRASAGGRLIRAALRWCTGAAWIAGSVELGGAFRQLHHDPGRVDAQCVGVPLSDLGLGESTRALRLFDLSHEGIVPSGARFASARKSFLQARAAPMLTRTYVAQSMSTGERRTPASP